MNSYSPIKLLIPVKILYFAFFVWFCVTGPLRPLANWDILGYVGAVFSYTEQNSELRKRSLEEIKKYISAEQYKSITSGSYFRETVANDDRAFIEQIPAYSLKPLYVLLTGILGTIIGNIALASVLISSAGFFLMGTSLYLLRPRGLYEPLWLISILGLLYLGNPRLTLLTKAATPDSLAAGFMLAGFWAYLCKPQSIYPKALMSLAIMTRPDAVITTACLFPLMVKSSIDRILSIQQLVWSMAIPMTTYLLCNVLYPGFGFKKLIIHALKGPFPYPSSIDTSQFMPFYFSALYNDFLSLMNLPRFAFFLIASLLLFAFSRNHYAKLIVLAALGNAMMKIVLFPNFDGGYQERYLFLSYFLTLFAAFNRQTDPSLFGDTLRKTKRVVAQKVRWLG